MGGVWERMIGLARKILDAMLHELPTKQLTHEVLTTLMAEVSTIVNNRPLTPVSNDPEAPEILTPNMILTQKSAPLPPPPGSFTPDDLHTAQWRQVQYLSNVFWARWKKEFLPLLQVRRKWVHDQPNLRVGDLVLVRNKETTRNDWPSALVTKTFPGDDGKVRKIEVTTAREALNAATTDLLPKLYSLLRPTNSTRSTKEDVTLTLDAKPINNLTYSYCYVIVVFSYHCSTFHCSNGATRSFLTRFILHCEANKSTTRNRRGFETLSPSLCLRVAIAIL